jgi:hypothetical protein
LRYQLDASDEKAMDRSVLTRHEEDLCRALTDERALFGCPTWPDTGRHCAR